MTDRPPCPDGGTCHHECTATVTCFRVSCCEPLSGVFPNDEWPADVLAAHREPTTVVQVRRTKGYRRPPGTVMVDRSTRWGNRYRVVGPYRRTLYKVCGPGGIVHGRDLTHPDALALAADLFAKWAEHSDDPGARALRRDVVTLAGSTLGCWCPETGPCHARTLARLADAAAARLDAVAADLIDGAAVE